MKVALLGATKGMGRALARADGRARRRAVPARPRPRRPRRAAPPICRCAAPPATVGVAHCDLLEPDTFAPALDAAGAALGGLDTVVVTAGLFATQDAARADAALRDRLLTADFTNTVQFCEHARKRLLAARRRHAVRLQLGGGRARPQAGDPLRRRQGRALALPRRPRPQVPRAGPADDLVKPGFVKTGMTAGLPPPPFAGEPEAVARASLRAIDRGTPVVYAPGIWRWVMLVIRMLPRFVMRRIGF